MEACEHIQTLEQQVAWYKRQLFGSKADRVLPEDPSQFKIPFAEDPAQANKVKEEEEQARLAEKEQEEKKKKFRARLKPHSYMWAFYNTEDAYPFFEYRKSREYDGAKTLFTPYVKMVQSDGYGAYEAFEARKGCTHLCCWAHTRRYQNYRIIKSHLQPCA